MMKRMVRSQENHCKARSELLRDVQGLCHLTSIQRSLSWKGTSHSTQQTP